jgi:hypothetical protein
MIVSAFRFEINRLFVVLHDVASGRDGKIRNSLSTSGLRGIVSNYVIDYACAINPDPEAIGHFTIK